MEVKLQVKIAHCFLSVSRNYTTQTHSHWLVGWLAGWLAGCLSVCLSVCPSE